MIVHIHLDANDKVMVFSSPDCDSLPDQCDIARRRYFEMMAPQSNQSTAVVGAGLSTIATGPAATPEQLEASLQESLLQRVYFRRLPAR